MVVCGRRGAPPSMIMSMMQCVAYGGEPTPSGPEQGIPEEVLCVGCVNASIGVRGHRCTRHFVSGCLPYLRHCKLAGRVTLSPARSHEAVMLRSPTPVGVSYRTRKSLSKNTHQEPRCRRWVEWSVDISTCRLRWNKDTSAVGTVGGVSPCLSELVLATGADLRIVPT
jgi:hypothetical protein